MQSYDLFLHNCNNFSHDFAMFLVGKGIPEHITSLPQTVLNTPFGQMLKPQLDAAMRPVTQAPVPPSAVPKQPKRATTLRNGATLVPQQSTTSNGISSGNLTNGQNPHTSSPAVGTVHNVTNNRELERLLARAEKSCAVIFFTSATCPPCKIVYPAYDELAAEAGNKATLIKVDLSQAYDVGAKYAVRVTPTFMTFLHGEKEQEWSGANEHQLRSNIHLLLQMAHPPHPHTNLNLPSIQNAPLHPVTYPKLPPLDKLIAKMGPAGTSPAVRTMQHFLTQRATDGPKEAPLPDLAAFSAFILTARTTLPLSLLFPAVDLLRCALVDPRVSGYFAAEPAESAAIPALLTHIADLDAASCPYALRLVTLHLAANLFTSPLYPPRILADPLLAVPTVQLAVAGLLDSEHSNLRVAAASLAFNLAAANLSHRLETGAELLPEGEQLQLVAGLVEAVGAETESEEALRGEVLALGLLVYCAEGEGEVLGACRGLGAGEVVRGKGRGEWEGKKAMGLVREVGGELLGKGVGC